MYATHLKQATVYSSDSANCRKLTDTELKEQKAQKRAAKRPS